jgi:hypothetical protein
MMSFNRVIQESNHVATDKPVGIHGQCH